MTVMLFDHPRIAMAQRSRNHAERHICPPGAVQKQAGAPWLAGCQAGGEIPSFLRQHDVTRPAALADANPHRARIGIEVRGRHHGRRAISAAGQQGTGNQGAEIGRAGVCQPACVVIREIPEPGRVSLAEGADRAPRVIAGASPFAIRTH
jgi:hypothetical protein